MPVGVDWITEAVPMTFAPVSRATLPLLMLALTVLVTLVKSGEPAALPDKLVMLVNRGEPAALPARLVTHVLVNSGLPAAEPARLVTLINVGLPAALPVMLF